MIDTLTIAIRNGRKNVLPARAETASVKHTLTFIEKLIHPTSPAGISPFGLIFGETGIGKSVAVQAALDAVHPFSQTRLLVNLPPKASPTTLIEAISAGLGEYVGKAGRKKNGFNGCVKIFQEEQTNLLIIDDAEQLSPQTLGLLWQLHQETGVTIVFVGLPDIRRIFHATPETDRQAQTFRFPLATTAEVLDIILPQLGVEGWVYDPANDEDRTIGKFIWQKVNPSLRQLRLVVQLAVLIAKPENRPVNTLHFDRAFDFLSGHG